MITVRTKSADGPEFDQDELASFVINKMIVIELLFQNALLELSVVQPA